MINKEVLYNLKSSQVGLTSTVLIRAVLLFIWTSFSSVDGFALYNAPDPLAFHAISHLWFWLAFDWFVLIIGALTLGFGISIYEDGLQVSLVSASRQSNLWFALDMIGIMANITHIVASSLELAQCTSTLCLANDGFLIALIVILGIILVLYIVELIKIHVYKKAIHKSLKKTMRILYNNKRD